MLRLIFCFFFYSATFGLVEWPKPLLAATADEATKNLRNLSAPQRKRLLEEGARKEGEAVWYTSMSLTDFPKIVGAFEKSYPYVKIKTNRLSQSSIMPKIETEARAGHYAVDLVASAPVEMWELKQRNFSAPYLSPELIAFPAGSFDPQGYWSSTEVTPIVLALNTKLVAPDDAPKSYQDLLNPKWRGKMNFGSDEYAWYSVLLDGMGKAKGMDFMRAPGTPAAAYSRRQQHHALAVDARRRILDGDRGAGTARDRVQRKRRAGGLSLTRPLSR